jgi:hypothetical protein
MIDGDEAERIWLMDTSDTEAAVQSVAANPSLWHSAKAAILEDLNHSDHCLSGETADELYMEYIGLAQRGMEFATECRAKGQDACTVEEWAKYVRIAEAIGLDPDQRSDTLTPFRHVATGVLINEDGSR